MKLFFVIITSCILLTSCTGQTKNKSSKAKNTPEVNKMLEAYNKQKHRLAFNGCEMTYNEKPFKQGMTIKELITILGNYDSKHKMFYIWNDIGIVISAKENAGPKFKSRNIYIYMNTEVSEDYREDLKHKLNHKKDYFLLEGMPIDKNMHVMDFIDNSEFSLHDFGVSNYGYELDYNCDGKKIGYRLKADGLWLRKGVGHLTYKDKPNPENTNPFEMLYITEIKD